MLPTSSDPPLPLLTDAGAPLPSQFVDGDLTAVGDWLHEVATALSANTWINYRKEAERFLLWLRHQQLALAQVQRPLVNRYQQLLQQPPADWVNPRRTPRADPAWRPFAGPLKPSSIRQAMTILHNLFEWLLLHERAQVQRNPFRKVRVARERATQFEERMLSPAAVQALRDTVEALPRDSLRDHMHYFRARWLIALLLIGGLRREEVENGAMGDFRYDASYDVWSLSVLGKGEKVRDVTVTAQLLDELRFYRRQALGQEDLPAPNDPTPLVFTINGRGWRDPRTVCGQHLYKIIKTLLAKAAAHAEAAQQPHLAKELRQASPHWFRHASITNKLEAGIPIEDVAEEHGHVNISTTQRYAHKARGRRALRMLKLDLLNPGVPPKRD